MTLMFRLITLAILRSNLNLLTFPLRKYHWLDGNLYVMPPVLHKLNGVQNLAPRFLGS